MSLFPDRLDQVFLAREMRVDAARAQSGFPDHVLNCRLMKSLPGDASLGRLEDFVATRSRRLRLYLWHEPPSSFSARLGPPGADRFLIRRGIIDFRSRSYIKRIFVL